MILGILSDSHGQVERTRSAVQLLIDGGVEMLIHLGDIGSEAVIDELVCENITTHVVFGNCDDHAGLALHARCMGVIVDDPMGLIEVDGRRIAFTHGHHTYLMSQAFTSGVDYLLHGHTHQVRDERIGKTRVINPGALQRAARYTAALLNPAEDDLNIREVPRHPISA